MDSNTFRPPQWSLSDIFPKEDPSWTFANENADLRQHRLDKNGCEETEGVHHDRGQSHSMNSPASPSISSETSEKPVVHFLACKGNHFSGRYFFGLSRTLMDRIGHEWEIPPNLFEHFHISPGYVTMNHLCEYEPEENSNVSAVDPQQFRSLNIAVADFENENNWYLLIMRHDILTQATVCLYIYLSSSKAYDPVSKLREMNGDILQNPLNLFWIASNEHVLSQNSVKKNPSTGWSLHYELRAKLDVTPDDKWIGERFPVPKEDYQSLTAELYQASQTVIELEAYFTTGIRNLKRLKRINKTFYHIRQTGTEDSNSWRRDDSTAYWQLKERIKSLIHELEYQTNELRSYASLLRCQFSVLYNMINQRDNQLSITMAKSNKDIAEAMRQDGMYMKTIAIVTLVFLPATFISAVFSTTLFDSLDSNDHLWWIYLLLCLALTATTLAVWFSYMTRWRIKEAARNKSIGDVEERTGRLQAPLDGMPMVDLSTPSRMGSSSLRARKESFP